MPLNVVPKSPSKVKKATKSLGLNCIDKFISVLSADSKNVYDQRLICNQMQNKQCEQMQVRVCIKPKCENKDVGYTNGYYLERASILSQNFAKQITLPVRW